MKKEIDARGLACPRPVILTKKELDQLAQGEVRTLVDNEVATQNLSKLAGSMGFLFNTETLGENNFAVTITKGEAPETADKVEDIITPIGKGVVIAVQSDQMGRGDEILGKLLIKSFMYTVKETTPHPEAILFFNSGVRLTVKDSPVLDDLKALEELGTMIISCGTCLDFYNLKNELAVGEISNMYTIYEKMSGANKTITIG
jgi:selenium metabolism protein YedF